MVQRRTGFAVSWQTLSPILGIFRVQPAAGGRFPDYEALAEKLPIVLG